MGNKFMIQLYLKAIIKNKQMNKPENKNKTLKRRLRIIKENMS